MDRSSPWFTIWTEPRKTIAQIVEKNPNHRLWTLAWIYGFCALMNMYQSMGLGAVYSATSIIIAAIIIAPLCGWLLFSIWSLVTFWTGKWFKGQASYKNVRAAYAWSCVPYIVNVPLWGLMAFLFGHQLFLNQTGVFSNVLVFISFIAALIKVAMSVWSLVIYINMISEVQKYSVVKAIFNLIVATVIIGVVFYLVWSLVIVALNGLAS